MSATVTSTKAKVRDPQKVRETLDSYHLEGVEFDLRQEGPAWVLQASSHEPDHESDETPRAVRREGLPDEDDYPNEDDYLDAIIAIDEIRDAKGREGFLDLLRQLAAHLESPLLILSAAASPVGGFGYDGRVWRVGPGAQQVEMVELSVDAGRRLKPQPEAASAAPGRHCLSHK
jgi:hypothetical protein